MEQEQTTRSPEEEKQVRLKRCIAVVVFGTLSVFTFFYLANGIVEIIMADALPEDKVMLKNAE